jgi:hypothetical protein
MKWLWPRLSMLLLGGFGFFLLLGLVELGFRAFVPETKPEWEVQGFESRPEIGPKPVFVKKNLDSEMLFSENFKNIKQKYPDDVVPKFKTRVIFKKQNEIIYDTEYATDFKGRRITPQKNLKQKSRFILFEGASTTFGFGVNPQETLPFYVSDLASNYRAYNYGTFGAGPNSVLARLEHTNPKEEVREKQGLLIYPMIDAHMRRPLGPMSMMYNGAVGADYYKIDGENNLIHAGSFESGRPWLTRFYIFLAHSRIVQYFKIDIPWAVSESQVRYVARLLEESKKVFQQKFGSDDFYVLFWPDSIQVKRLIPYLNAAGVRFLDYSRLPVHEMTHGNDVIKYDGHPTALTHKIIALKIIQDLKLLHPAVSQDSFLSQKNISPRHLLMTVDGDVIFDVEYSTDQWGRRQTPQDEKGRHEIARFWGGSVVFGESVESEDTLSGQVAKLTGKTKTYNYGLRKATPEDVLKWSRELSSQTTKQNISGVEKRDIYILDDEQVALFLKKTRWTSKTEGYEALVKQIKELKQELIKKSDSQSFSAILWPGSSYINEILPLLKEAQIDLLDYHSLKGERYITGQWKAPIYKTVAEKIITDLKLK